jgi:hypothetical protein
VREGQQPCNWAARAHICEPVLCVCVLQGDRRSVNSRTLLWRFDNKHITTDHMKTLLWSQCRPPGSMQWAACTWLASLAQATSYHSYRFEPSKTWDQRVFCDVNACLCVRFGLCSLISRYPPLSLKSGQLHVLYMVVVRQNPTQSQTQRDRSVFSKCQGGGPHHYDKARRRYARCSRLFTAAKRYMQLQIAMK